MPATLPDRLRFTRYADARHAVDTAADVRDVADGLAEDFGLLVEALDDLADEVEAVRKEGDDAVAAVEAKYADAAAAVKAAEEPLQRQIADLEHELRRTLTRRNDLLRRLAKEVKAARKDPTLCLDRIDAILATHLAG
jgi:ABC-type transporter Mla subunit MlaD